MNSTDLKTIQTPAYVFDTDALANHIKTMTTHLDETTSLCYAMKANPFLIEAIEPSVRYIEVCSFGEFQICEARAIPMGKILLSGVHKDPDETEYIVKTYGDALTYTLESLTQFHLLERLAQTYNCVLKVMIRLSSNNQFGVSEDDFNTIGSAICDGKTLNLIGVHYFAGTQKTAENKFDREFSKLESFIQAFEIRFGYKNLDLEYGPGLAVDYFFDDHATRFDALHRLCETIKQSTKRHVTLEVGRFMVAYCGRYITQVVDTKIMAGQHYCIVDGGIHHVSYYGQNMAMKTPPLVHIPHSHGESTPWTVFGSLCTTNDILVRQAPLVDLKIGDYLIFEKTGAYAMTEGISLFLSHALPSVYFKNDDNALTLIRAAIPTYSLNTLNKGNC